MTDLCRLIFWTLVDLMRARATLEAEIWVLRQQINVLRRARPQDEDFGAVEELLFQQGFEPGASLVSSYPSGASLFQTILNRRSTKLWRKMPSPGDKSPSPPLLSTVWFFEKPNFIEGFAAVLPRVKAEA